MADNFEQGTITPYFPLKCIESHAEELDQLGVSWEPDGYLYIEDGCTDWDQLAVVLQEMLTDWQCADPAAAAYAYIEVAYTCSKMRQGEFGGFAIFITPTEVHQMGSGQFVVDCMAKYNKGEIR